MDSLNIINMQGAMTGNFLPLHGTMHNSFFNSFSKNERIISFFSLNNINASNTANDLFFI